MYDFWCFKYRGGEKWRHIITLIIESHQIEAEEIKSIHYQNGLLACYFDVRVKWEVERERESDSGRAAAVISPRRLRLRAPIRGGRPVTHS